MLDSLKALIGPFVPVRRDWIVAALVLAAAWYTGHLN